jgi:hypothetical protein
MHRFVRACVSVLFLAAAALAAGCGGFTPDRFTGDFSADKFLQKSGGDGP